MSHVATIDLDILDLDCLKLAAAELGLEFCEGKTNYKWWGHSVGDFPLPAGFAKGDLGKCEHAMRIGDNAKAYEIGICKRRDGKPGWVMLWDFFAGGYGLQAKVGENAGKLTQKYATHVAIKQARRQGFSVQQRQLADGRVQLTLNR